MKFCSKNSNYRIVLKHGQPAEPVTGRAAVSMIAVKFEDGKADINSNIGDLSKEEVCKILLNNPAYKRDYVLVKDEQDPYEDLREPTEPVHTVMEMERGSIGKTVNPKGRIPLDKEKKKMIKDMATKMAKDMVKEIVPKLVKEMLEKAVKEKETKEGQAKLQTNEKDETIDNKNVK